MTVLAIPNQGYVYSSSRIWPAAKLYILGWVESARSKNSNLKVAQFQLQTWQHCPTGSRGYLDKPIKQK